MVAAQNQSIRTILLRCCARILVEKPYVIAPTYSSAAKSYL